MLKSTGKNSDVYLKPAAKVGILGGMGSSAGLMLANKLIELSPAVSDQEQIETFIHSNTKIPDRTEAILYNGRSSLPELLRSIEILNSYGADIVVMACVTSYYYFSEVRKHVRGIIINPIELVSKYILEKHHSMKRVGLLASTGTVRTKLFSKKLSVAGVEVVSLSEVQQEKLMQAIYMRNGLKSRKISDQAHQLLSESASELIKVGIDGLIGGCSEIHSGLKGVPSSIPFIDTMEITAREIINMCYTPVSVLEGTV